MTGSWSDPVVTRRERPTPSAARRARNGRRLGGQRRERTVAGHVPRRGGADGLRRRRRGQSRAGRAADRRGRGRRRAAGRAARVLRHPRRAGYRQGRGARARRRRPAAGVPRRGRRARTASGSSAAPCRSPARDPARVRSACLVYGPDGTRVARYDKIHLFAFARGDERYDEGRTIEPGTHAGDLRRCPAGASACRSATTCAFPSSTARWATLALILVPAAFTATTGAAHWHLLLRARAVENQCYVLAAAQGGLHPNGRRTYGHSVLSTRGARSSPSTPRGRASSSATSIRRGSPKCARSCRRSRTATMWSELR